MLDEMISDNGSKFAICKLIYTYFFNGKIKILYWILYSKQIAIFFCILQGHFIQHNHHSFGCMYVLFSVGPTNKVTKI